MAIPTIPTIQEIKDRIVSDIETAINQTIPALPISFVRVLASAIAGGIYLLYQAILWVYKQIFPQSADLASLVLLGALVGITQFPKVSAVIVCDVPGTGAQVDQGELFVGSNGITYRVQSSVAIIGGVATGVLMDALEGGDKSNLINGEVLNIVETNLNLDGTATVTGTNTSGDDAESKESFSARVIARYRKRIEGGAPADYYFWGLETPNAIWIGPYANITIPHQVDVYMRVDNQPDGIPTAGQLTELESFLNFDPETGKAYRRPISDVINTKAITVKEFDVTISINGATVDTKTAVEAAVIAYLPTLEPYIEGISDERKDTLTNSDVSTEADAVAEQDGAKVITVTIFDVSTGFIENDYQFIGGEFGKFRTVTFIDV